MLKMYVIGLYGSVIQCKRMLEGELSNRMSDLFFCPLHDLEKEGRGRERRALGRARSAVCPVDLSP